MAAVRLGDDGDRCIDVIMQPCLAIKSGSRFQAGNFTRTLSSTASEIASSVASLSLSEPPTQPHPSPSLSLSEPPTQPHPSALWVVLQSDETRWADATSSPEKACAPGCVRSSGIGAGRGGDDYEEEEYDEYGECDDEGDALPEGSGSKRRRRRRRHRTRRSAAAEGSEVESAPFAELGCWVGGLWLGGGSSAPSHRAAAPRRGVVTWAQLGVDSVAWEHRDVTPLFLPSCRSFRAEALLPEALLWQAAGSLAETTPWNCMAEASPSHTTASSVPAFSYTDFENVRAGLAQHLRMAAPVSYED